MKPLWKEYSDTRPHLLLQRPDFLTHDLCGFYNNWFILDLDWIFQPNVQDWLQWMDNTGYIYRKRVNDLIIHTTAAYAFLPPTRIHRFLDFTYEHFTDYKESGCPLWGAISGGYDDDHALERVLIIMPQPLWPNTVLVRTKRNPTSQDS
jgi:alpha 1,2-mannosyltransferase